MSNKGIPETYNSAFMKDYLLNINGTASLVYEVSSGLEISDNLECVISLRKRTSREIENNERTARDMMIIHNSVKHRETKSNYKDIWDIDISYKLSNNDAQKLSQSIKKMEEYCYAHKVVLYLHSISSAKQLQSFYPGFVEMNGHLYCVTQKKCKDIVSNSALDLSFFLEYAKDGDMIQTYTGVGSRKIYVAISFLFDVDFEVKFNDIFRNIHQKRQQEFEDKISERKNEIRHILQRYVKNFSEWKQLNNEYELRKIFGQNYEFGASQFSYVDETERKYGQIVSISDLTSSILSKGFL